MTHCKIRYCSDKLLWGIHSQQRFLFYDWLAPDFFSLSLSLSHTHTHAHRYAVTSKEVWHAFVGTCFVSREQGTLCRGVCPCTAESFVSLHPQAPPPPPPALQWESLQVLTLSGGGQSQVRDLLLGYHQISGWGKQQWGALSFRACHVILFICRLLSGRQKGYLAHAVAMKHIKILKPAMLSTGKRLLAHAFFYSHANCQAVT